MAAANTLTSFDRTGNIVSGIDLGRHEQVKDIAFDVVSNQLCVALKDKLRRYGADGVLASETVLRKIERIAVDGQGCLWAATDKRLARMDPAGHVLFVIDPFGRRCGHGKIIDLAADSVDCSAWVLSSRLLSHVSAEGDNLGTADPDPAERDRLMALALYRDLTAPTIQITSPANESYINSSTPLIAVSCNDPGSGIDPLSLAFTSNASIIETECVFDGSGAACNLMEPLSEGTNRLRATIKDYEGNSSAPSEVEFTVDTIAPEITLSSPADGLIAKQPEQTLTGQLSETATLQVNGKPLSIAEDQSFSETTTLQEGSNTFLFEAVDRAGNTGRIAITLTLDTVPPAPVTVGLLAIGEVIDGRVTVAGTSGSVEAGAEVTLTNLRSGETAVAIANTEGSFLVQIGARAGDTLSIVAADRAGNESAGVSVDVGSPLPPAVEKIPEGSFGHNYRDLVPMDATIEEYSPHRFSLITGKVRDINGSPISEVTVSIHSHPEYGTATTDHTGQFTLPVEGGGILTAVFNREDRLTSHRQVYVPWNDTAIVETVQLIERDPASTEINFNGDPDTVITHMGTAVTDSFGKRACTLVFTGDNRAFSLDSDGNVTGELTSFTARSTEFITPRSMPAKLPPNSGYTYCVELQADGVERVRFEKPVITWIDNFLGFQVGMAVPVGFYDRDRGVWAPSDNGRVVRLLDMDSDGIVDALDATGDGQPDDLNGNGSYGDDVAGLADNRTYQPGSTFWRVEIKHFTPWDHNWPYGPPEDAIAPNPSADPMMDQQKSEQDDCRQPVSSFVEERSRILHEDISIPGTGIKLHYASNRVEGYKPVISVPVSGPAVPASLKQIIVKVRVAGRVFEEILPPLANRKMEFVWDGLDHLGRPIVDPVLAHIDIGFVYPAVYYSPADFGQAFARAGSDVTGIMARDEVISWKNAYLAVDAGKDISRSAGSLIADGWTLSVHHHLSPVAPSTLHKGDGTSTTNDVTWIIDTMAGNGKQSYSGDGGPSGVAELAYPFDVAVDAAGNVYIADSSNHRIRKVDTNGIISTIAGGRWESLGDGGPATEAMLYYPYGVAVDAEGKIYIADYGNHRIRMVDQNGIISTIAGNGTFGYGGDGGPATEAMLFKANGVAVDAGGNVYIADSHNHRIRMVDTNGIIHTFAGNGQGGYSGDGGPATAAKLRFPHSVAVDAQGNIYIADEGNDLIRKVPTTGIISTVAGNGLMGYSGDGGTATEAKLSYPYGVAVDATGNIYIADEGNGRIRKVDTSGTIHTIAGSGMFGDGGDGGPATFGKLRYPLALAVNAAGTIYIADYGNHRIRKAGLHSASGRFMHQGDIVFSEESGLAHIISSSGRHIKTIDQDTGVDLYKFHYDDSARILSITDRFGEKIVIERDTNGTPTAITSPDGITTRLSIDTKGHLTRITYPDGNHYDFEYTPEGLLTAKIEPEGNLYEYSFDPAGKLSDIRDQENGHWQYVRTFGQNGTVLTERLTGEGNLTSYLDRTYSTGAYSSTITDPTGAQTIFTLSADGLTADKSLPCGMSFSFQYGIDTLYKFPYVKQSTRRTSSGLSRVTLFEKLYEDTDTNGISDRITDKFTINGKLWTLLLDTLQSKKVQTSPSGRTLTSYYDPSNLLTTRIAIPELHETNLGHDSKGRLTSVGTGTRETTLVYDSRGNLSSYTDPENHTTSYSYDPVGRVGSIERPDGSTLAFSYDANGNMTVLAAPSGIDHTFGYNRVNRNVSYEAPLSGSYAYTYDRDRRLKEIRFPSGESIRNTYEDTRLIRVETPDEEITMSYLCGTKLGSLTMGTESLSYGYDGSLLTSEAASGTINQSIGYVYNSDFLVSRMIYAGEAVDYTYDSDGLLTGSGLFTVTRNGLNGLPTAVTGGPLSISRTYSGYGELDGQDVSFNGASRYSWNVTRDNAGRITSKTETVDGATSRHVYGYDSMGRLLTVTRDGTEVESYQYGASGSRLSETNLLRGIASRDMTYSDEDHLLEAGEATYQYDADGFLTAKTLGQQTTYYDYSSRGELLGVTLPDGTAIEYVHDPLGRRIAKKIDGTVTEKYLWQGLIRLLAVFDGDDKLIMRFQYADSRMPISMTRGESTYYLSFDQVGSLKLITNASGAVVKHLDYDSFGNILSDSNPSFSVPLGFAGGLHDRDTGLVRFGYRDYDPDVGRWCAKDPILFAGGDTNLYGYCIGDPINLIDVFGLYTWPYSWQGWAGVTLGLAALAVAPVSLTTAGVLLGSSAVFTIWDAISGAMQVEEDFGRRLEPSKQAFDERMREIDEFEQDMRNCP